MPFYRKYAQISLQKREKLIELVIGKAKSIAKAARQLAIKPSTAKRIVKIYRATGKFTVKKRDILTHLLKEEAQWQASSETTDRKEAGSEDGEASCMKSWSIPVVYSMVQSQCLPHPFYVLTSVRISQ